MTYEVKSGAAPHTCWDDPQWDGCVSDDCLGCKEAVANPCEYCGYGHAFTTHNPEAHDENGDPLIATMVFDPDLSETWVWVNSPHIYPAA